MTKMAKSHLDTVMIRLSQNLRSGVFLFGKNAM